MAVLLPGKARPVRSLRTAADIDPRKSSASASEIMASDLAALPDTQKPSIPRTRPTTTTIPIHLKTESQEVPCLAFSCLGDSFGTVFAVAAKAGVVWID